MNKYPKIQTVYKRDPDNNYKTLLGGVFSCPEFEYLKDNKWDFMEKVDGSNIRIIYSDNSISFAGRTDKAQIQEPLLAKLNTRFKPRLSLFRETFGDADVCFYGEGYGPKIQKGGGNYRNDQDFVLFDIKINGWWLKREDVFSIGSKFGVDVVPLIGDGTLSDMVQMVKGGIRSEWGDFDAEGIVAKPSIELKARNGQRIITKIKCSDFEK